MKSLFASKTFWYNVLTGLGLFFALPQFTELLPPNALQYVLLLNAGINILLRYVTTGPVSVTGSTGGSQ